MSEDQKNESGESSGTSEAPKSRAGNNGETSRSGKGPRSSSSRDSGSRGTKSRSSNRGVVTGVLSAVVILAAGGGAVAATSMVPEPSGGGTTMDIRQADVPAGRSMGVCPEPARLVSGTVVGTDADFSPVSTTATSALNAVVLSNPAGTVPESDVTSLGGEMVDLIAKLLPARPHPRLVRPCSRPEWRTSARWRLPPLWVPRPLETNKRPWRPTLATQRRTATFAALRLPNASRRATTRGSWVPTRPWAERPS